MPTPLDRLADHPSARDPEPFAGPDHPIRILTRAVAAGKRWSPANAAKMAELFDGLAPDWSERHVDPTKAAPIVDALDRGMVPLDGLWLELGSGTGAGSRVLHDRVRALVTAELSAEMLRRAPAELASRLRADASAAPIRSDAVDAVLLVNMLLFPDEVDRVLRPDGTLVWVNTLGDQTPIHLSATDVIAAMPGTWHGTTARAGTGFWLVARRDPAGASR
jgi:SAM-dependent methyltransferase